MAKETLKESRIAEISAVLTGARKQARALPGFPAALPASLGEAYRVQHASRADWPDRTAGWKVGGIPPGQVEALGSRYLAGPIFAADVVRTDGGQGTAMPVFDGGFAAIEPELVLELGESRDADRAFIGVEIASSPLPAINDIGPLAVVCDFGNNKGVLLGPEVPDWRTALARGVRVVATIDNVQVGNRLVENLARDALAALDFLIAHAAREGFALPPGTLVSTGAITGVHEASVGARSRLDFDRFGSLDVELVPATPLELPTS